MTEVARNLNDRSILKNNEVQKFLNFMVFFCGLHFDVN